MKLLSYALRKICQHSWHIFLSAAGKIMIWGWEKYARSASILFPAHGIIKRKILTGLEIIFIFNKRFL
jgi:hypothetical protein